MTRGGREGLRRCDAEGRTVMRGLAVVEGLGVVYKRLGGDLLKALVVVRWLRFRDMLIVGSDPRSLAVGESK
jgi:hypothetical protein